MRALGDAENPRYDDAGGSAAVGAEPYAALARLGVASVYEAAGRVGMLDLPLRRIVPGTCVAGRARTIRCLQDDNLGVHAAIPGIRPGDVVVITMPEPRPVGLIGDLLATQMRVAGAAAVLVDAAVRDVDELARIGLPVWSSFVRVRGCTKDGVGTHGGPVVVGGATIREGDAVVLDGDGAVVVAAERVGEVVDAAGARLEHEAGLRARFEAGEHSWDVMGFARHHRLP